MNKQDLQGIFTALAQIMGENREELIRLDQQNGDGDLGITMENGMRAAQQDLLCSEQTDLGRLLNHAADCFNEAAPSTLGTILAFYMKGVARALKGKETANCEEMALALRAGAQNITSKAGSKPGEKTILDALCPGTEALLAHAEEMPQQALRAAAQAAAIGAESTRQMKAVWGRAAYYADAGVGKLDGGAAAGSLIFQAFARYYGGEA